MLPHPVMLESDPGKAEGSLLAQAASVRAQHRTVIQARIVLAAAASCTMTAFKG